MARLPRSTFPAYGVWHVTTRGVERRRVYLDRGDGRWFLTQLWRAVAERKLEVYALCLMPNHYHLVVEGPRDSLSKAMHRVNGVYAQAFNVKYRRSGHLWGDRFALWQVRDEEHLRKAIAYVLDNPVRAGLCARAADWPWSGSRYASSARTETVAEARIRAKNVHPASAFATAASSPAASISACARTSSSDATIWCPFPSTSSSVTVQATSSRSTVPPARAISPASDVA